MHVLIAFSCANGGNEVQKLCNTGFFVFQKYIQMLSYHEF